MGHYKCRSFEMCGHNQRGDESLVIRLAILKSLRRPGQKTHYTSRFHGE